VNKNLEGRIVNLRHTLKHTNTDRERRKRDRKKIVLDQWSNRREINKKGQKKCRKTTRAGTGWRKMNIVRLQKKYILLPLTVIFLNV
jgi:hypothetical protein